MPLVIDDFGLDLGASGVINAGEADAAFLAAVQAKNRSQWTVGDLYRTEMITPNALNASTISLHTVQNYASVCGAWEKAHRLIPVSFSHYQSACHLVKTDVSAALRILQAAYDGLLDRDYVRDECAKALGDYAESAEMLLVYDGSVFVPSGVPTWLPDGYTITKTVRKS